MKKYLKTIFIIQLVLFLLVILLLFTQLNELFPLSPSIFFIISSLIGLVFTILIIKNIEKGKLKTMLVVNGLSSFGVMFFSVIHNLFYALGEVVGNVLLQKIISGIGGFFFILGVLICPIAFLVSSILSVIFYYKSRVVEQKK
jgi:hypothetical protein